METNSSHSNDTGSNKLKLDSSLDHYKQKIVSDGAQPTPSCSTSTMMSTVTPATGRDPPPSLEQSATPPSIASSHTRSRLLPSFSPQIAALLENAKKRQLTMNTKTQYQGGSNFSSLVSDGSFTVSLDENELLPLTKTETFQLTKSKDLEIDDDDASDDIHDTENMPCCENLKIVNEPAASEPKVQKLKSSEEQTKQHRRLSKSEHQQRQKNKRHRQHENEQPQDKKHPNGDSMSVISNITFDFPSAAKDTHKPSIIPPCNNNSSLNLQQETNHHHQNISTTTTNKKTSLDTEKTGRLESIHNRIILLQTENHNIKAANHQLVKQLKFIQDPNTIKLTMMQDRVKAIDLENHNLRERNLDLETEVKQQGLQLVEKDNMFRQYQQRQHSISLKLSQQQQQQQQHSSTKVIPFHQTIAGSGATSVQQQKEIEMQRNSYMTTRKKLEDKRKLCRDMLAEGRVSPSLSSSPGLLCASCRRRRDDSGGGRSKNRGEDNIGSIVSEEESGSFLSDSSMTLSNEDNNDDAYRATGDMVNKARSMVATQKQNQLEQEILTLNSKIKSLQELNGNLLSKFVEQEDDFQSVTKMETSSIQQQEEITSLRGQLKQKSNVCVSMEHQLVGLRTEMMDLKDMHEMMRCEYDNMKAEAGMEVDKLKNQVEIYKRKLFMLGNGNLEGDEDIGAVKNYTFNDDEYEYEYDAYDTKINTINVEKGDTMTENQNIMADFYNAKRYLQDAHEEAAVAGDDVVDTAGMEGLSKKEQENLIAEIAEERKKWQATTSPPTTPGGMVHKIPQTIDTIGGLK